MLCSVYSTRGQRVSTGLQAGRSSGEANDANCQHGRNISRRSPHRGVPQPPCTSAGVHSERVPVGDWILTRIGMIPHGMFGQGYILRAVSCTVAYQGGICQHTNLRGGFDKVSVCKHSVVCNSSLFHSQQFKYEGSKYEHPFRNIKFIRGTFTPKEEVGMKGPPPPLPSPVPSYPFRRRGCSCQGVAGRVHLADVRHSNMAA